ncbi:MAG: oligopeptide transporter, OPT family [Sphingomonas sp. SCN 67-18]|uniref:OPT family oligopeptide transporter n=1 Tax=uncultured Sphingomonas sp. TaxID=158754 RepID=UPI0008689C01|nr:oligopeptide transporter, OPT family [Sphingomonas sp. SCN 67-18]ODU22121.1 MAG: oligopeptide transporter, OPT family [Sphingomonas sp. SCN 67-18]
MSSARSGIDLPELTIRGIILGGLITLMFTAANVYLGLKVGLTFATSIPAAVISMAVLRMFATSNILENNIVQTVASAAGTLAAIIFVLPGLVIVGWWQGFPFWTTALVCALGGILGVMFSIPLRRALVTDSPLPYPEGVAAAEVLRVGAASREGAAESGRGLKVIVMGALASAGFSLAIGMKLALAEASAFFRIGASATGIAGGLSFALIGAGHLVGISVGMAMLTGLVLGWGIFTPVLTALTPSADPAEAFALFVWSKQVRFIGAGVIGVAAIWTLVRIMRPILSGIASAIAASRARRQGNGAGLPLTERDMPIGIVGLVTLATLVPIALLLASFISGGPLEPVAVPLVAGTLLFVLVIGAVIAAVCGYMAGLIGASNSPVSGVGILAIIAASLLLAGGILPLVGAEASAPLVAYALFATAIVFGIATISNDNLQDLKTGQLVGATPWRQQLALVFGVIFGSLVIPPVLELLSQAYGFAGAPGAGPNALPAPQAALISALAKGVLGGDLDWHLIGIGAAVGVAMIVIDELLGRAGKLRLPPLGVGIGIYLPMGTTFAVVIGAVLGWLYDRRMERSSADPETAKRMGVLLATGLIVGESLFGVALAALVVGSGNDSPLALVGDGFHAVALIGGTLAFIALTAWLYRRTARMTA